MTSFASEMPESPGCISQFDLYKNKPYVDPYEEQKQLLSSVQEENMRLKANLTRIQTEYEELRDESNYQRAKVSELTELTELMSSSTSPPSSFPTPQHSSSDANAEFADSTVHKSLIEKSLQNAELTLSLDQLKIELHTTKARLADLEIQKRANNKLLLEMGDVIRTLNSVDIQYAAFTQQGENLSAQQQSIKNIKVKVEVMLKDRKLIIQKCKELEEVTRAQEQKILALEAQFHIANSSNLSQGVALDDINRQRDISPTVSMAESTLSGDSTLSNHSSAVRLQSSLGAEPASFAPTDAAASEIVRQSQEIAKYKKQKEEQSNEISDLQHAQETLKETISRLEAHNDRLSTQFDGTKKSLGETKERLEDAVIKRDEFKENLVDIITHYKELQVEHEASNDQISKLQSMVVKLESKVRETQREIELKKPVEIEKPKKAEKTPIDCRMEDLLVAYSKAQKQIVQLQDSLMKKELKGNEYQDTSTRFKKMERERNDFQRKLDRAREETRLVKQEAQREKEESKRVRRQLKALMQNRDDETASQESGHTRRSTSSSRSRSEKKALVKKASFKPLTVEELMEKDFA